MSSKDSNFSLYNSKYLKYKNKYLSLKKTFGGGNGEEINIILVLPSGERSISIFTKDNLVQQIARQLQLHPLKIKLFSEDNEIDLDKTAEDCYIIESYRITVNINMTKFTTVGEFRPIADHIAQMTEYYDENGYAGGPELEYLMNDITFDPISNEIIDINFDTPLYNLPETFGNIKILGNLTLRDIRNFPENFGNIIIGGNLTLINCWKLPESFRKIMFLGNLTITSDEFVELPDNFGDFEVNGNMVLKINNLVLPKKFGSIKIGGDLDLRGNNLKELPKTFGKIKIGRDLYLSHNRLLSLPDSFQNFQVGGNLFLNNNKLTNLLDSFKHIKVNGVVDLQNNNFTEIPQVLTKEKFKDKYILDDKFTLL